MKQSERKRERLGGGEGGGAGVGGGGGGGQMEIKPPSLKGVREEGVLSFPRA